MKSDMNRLIVPVGVCCCAANTHLVKEDFILSCVGTCTIKGDCCNCVGE